jgi:hypothetical protein
LHVTLEARTPCLLCGYQQKVLRFSDVRVNKRSLRERGVSLIAVERFCPECREYISDGLMPVSAYRLHPDDAAKVAAYQGKRWPLTTGRSA